MTVVDIRTWLDRPEWMEHAACRGVDPDLFFPARGEDQDAVKAICAACPVRFDCLDYAMVNSEKFGVWGGLSEKQRRALRRHGRPTPPQIVHGTNGGHRAHLRRGEQPCVDCLHAHSEYQRHIRPSRASGLTA